MPARAKVRRISTSDYSRMREVGIISADERVELLDGAIHSLPAPSAQRAAIARRLNALLARHAGEHAIISVRDPIQLGEDSEPQPDFAVLKPRADWYAQAHPTPAEVLFVVELAEGALGADRTEKLARYAKVGVPEVWLVDLAGRTVEQYVQPRGGRYRASLLLEAGETIAAATLSAVSLGVDEIFG